VTHMCPTVTHDGTTRLQNCGKPQVGVVGRPGLEPGTYGLKTALQVGGERRWQICLRVAPDLPPSTQISCRRVAMRDPEDAEPEDQDLDCPEHPTGEDGEG
jgi:hypothetical protein